MRALFLVLLLGTLAAGCSDDPKQETEILAKACDEGGTKRPSGSIWTCSDGCNRCSCDNGVVEQTGLACTDTDPFTLDSFMPPADTSAPPDTSVADTAADGG